MKKTGDITKNIMCHSYTVMSSVIWTKKFASRPLEVPTIQIINKHDFLFEGKKLHVATVNSYKN
jgi:hypothetical protein